MVAVTSLPATSPRTGHPAIARRSRSSWPACASASSPTPTSAPSSAQRILRRAVGALANENTRSDPAWVAISRPSHPDTPATAAECCSAPGRGRPLGRLRRPRQPRHGVRRQEGHRGTGGQRHPGPRATIRRGRDRPSGTLWLAGVDEITHFNHDARATFAQIPPGAAILALWHEPDFAEQAAELGAFAQLSGHTHGGQVRFPFIGPLVLPRFGRRFIRASSRLPG